MDTELNTKELKSLAWVARYCFFGIILMCVTLCFVFAKTSIPEYRPIGVSSRTVVAGTAYQPSATRYVDVNVSVQIACAITISGGQAGSISLQTSPDGVTYTTVSQLTNANSGSLVVGVAITNTNGAVLKAVVPPGYYYKVVTTSTTGTPTFSILTNSQETSL